MSVNQLAELIAVQKMNKNEAQPVYGIVTDGELWQLGRLLLDVFTKEKTRIAITDLDKLFGAIAFLLAEFKDLV